MKKHYPRYEKTSDMYSLLKDKMDDAITNVEKLEKYYKKEEQLHTAVSCNPYTDVYKIVKML